MKGFRASRDHSFQSAAHSVLRLRFVQHARKRHRNQEGGTRISTCRSSCPAAEDINLKIAFVNRPIDTILPPYQSSVGACTYGAACSPSKFCEVILYGTRDRHKDFQPTTETKMSIFVSFQYRNLTGSQLGPEKIM